MNKYFYDYTDGTDTYLGGTFYAKDDAEAIRLVTDSMKAPKGEKIVLKDSRGKIINL